MFKLIRNVLIVAIILIIVWAISGKKIGGKTPGDYWVSIKHSKFYKETLRDVRTILGESFKAVGDAISDDVTPSDSEELQKIIKEDMKKKKKEQ